MSEITRCGLLTLDDPSSGLIEPLLSGLRENGCDGRVYFYDSEWDFNKCDFIISYGPMTPMGLMIERLLRMRSRLPPLVFWFTEPIPPPNSNLLMTYYLAKIRFSLEKYYGPILSSRLKKNRILMSVLKPAGRLRILGEMIKLKEEGILRLLCVFTKTIENFFKKYNFPVVQIPFGYHPLFGKNMNLERDIDVTFIGSTFDHRRKKIVKIIDEELNKRGIRFIIKDGSVERGSVYGQERTILLNRTRIVLGIMRQPWDDQVFRFLHAAPNGAMLLSEKILTTSLGPLIPDEHIGMMELSRIVDAIEFYLQKPEEILRITRNASELISSRLSIKETVAGVLAALDNV